MPVSGLIITLERDPERARAAVARLRSEPGLELGAAQGARLPAVLDNDVDPRANRAIVQALADVPGVAAADVVFVHVEDH